MTEQFHGYTADLNHLRVIGCLCYATKVVKQDKFSPRAKACTLIGYSPTQKGYLLYSLSQKRFIVSRDVIFREDIFPFNQILNKQQPLFPAESMPISDDFPIYSKDRELPIPIPAVETYLENDHMDVPDCLQGDVSDDRLPAHSIQAADGCNTDQPDPVLMRNGNVALRKSTRSIHPPIWMKDYVTPTTKCHSQSNYVCYDNVSSKYKAFLSEFSTDIEPKTFEEAAKDKRWVLAMQQEVQALEENGTWRIVELPQGKNVVGCKWVFKIKYKADGKVDRYKARLVAKGYSQTEGIDYHETFSPVVKMTTVRSIIALAATQSWNIYQMNVFNAFLQGDLLEEVYMELPKGFFSAEKGKNLVCKLVKSLYGLK